MLEDEWIVVRDPNDGELRVVPAKVRSYFLDTEPKWEFVAEGKLETLQSMCELTGPVYVTDAEFYPDMTDDGKQLDCKVYMYGPSDWWRDEEGE